MKLEDYFKNRKVYIWREAFAIAKSKRPLTEAFAVIRDKDEITVIIDQSKIDSYDIIEVKKDWKMLTFDIILPFGLIGFLAKVSKVLADEKISIFVISAYSTDHILVEEKELVTAIKKLEDLGCFIEYK